MPVGPGLHDQRLVLRSRQRLGVRQSVWRYGNEQLRAARRLPIHSVHRRAGLLSRSVLHPDQSVRRPLRRRYGHRQLRSLRSLQRRVSQRPRVQPLDLFVLYAREQPVRRRMRRDADGQLRHFECVCPGGEVCTGQTCCTANGSCGGDCVDNCGQAATQCCPRDSGPTCSATGATCSSASECCSGVCTTAASGGLGTCATSCTAKGGTCLLGTSACCYPLGCQSLLGLGLLCE